MTTCNKTWAERYVTATKNVSIQVLQHRCDLPVGHEKDAKRPRKCQCYCAPRPGFNVREVIVPVDRLPLIEAAMRRGRAA